LGVRGHARDRGDGAMTEIKGLWTGNSTGIHPAGIAFVEVYRFRSEPDIGEQTAVDVHHISDPRNPTGWDHINVIWTGVAIRTAPDRLTMTDGPFTYDMTVGDNAISGIIYEYDGEAANQRYSLSLAKQPFAPAS
jgi:hypothetical protein